MDRLERKSLALAAARRLALAAALGGCGNVILAEEPPPVDEPPAEDPTPVTMDPPVLSPPKPPQLSAASDCPTYVAENLPLDGSVPPADPELEACCDELLGSAEWGVQPPAPVTTDMLWQCCSVTGFDAPNTPYCTPWGPPVPPRLTRALRALIAREALS